MSTNRRISVTDTLPDFFDWPTGLPEIGAFRNGIRYPLAVFITHGRAPIPFQACRHKAVLPARGRLLTFVIAVGLLVVGLGSLVSRPGAFMRLGAGSMSGVAFTKGLGAALSRGSRSSSVLQNCRFLLRILDNSRKFVPKQMTEGCGGLLQVGS